jgi:4-diphosphocytidyl-2-C-methyl-D-erythritol kinase
MNAASQLTIACPAKVNLSLSVGAPDPKRGLHPIASWMVALQFADALTLARAETAAFDIRFVDDRHHVDWPLEKDLAYRAHGVIESHVGRSLPIALRLAKRIPPGAGLGGGSSDAAGVLVGVNQLYDLGLSRDTLIELGLKLGSDIGFLVAALCGEPSMVVTGFGDRFDVLPLDRTLHLAMIFPGFGSPTGPVYAAFDRLRPDARVVDKLTPGEPFNDLAAAACDVTPKLGEIQRGLSDVLGLNVHITGSGSTLFVLADDQQQAKAVAAAVERDHGLQAVATQSMTG